jgi:hypothetical protein
MVLAVNFLVETTFFVDLLSLWLVLKHNYFEADPPELDSVSDPQMQTTIHFWHIRTVSVSEFNDLPGFVRRLNFFFFVILHQKFVIDPEIPC